MGADRFDHRCGAFEPVDIDGPGVEVRILTLQPQDGLGRGKYAEKVSYQSVQIGQLDPVLFIRHIFTGCPPARAVFVDPEEGRHGIVSERVDEPGRHSARPVLGRVHLGSAQINDERQCLHFSSRFRAGGAALASGLRHQSFPVVDRDDVLLAIFSQDDSSLEWAFRFHAPNTIRWAESTLERLQLGTALPLAENRQAGEVPVLVGRGLRGRFGVHQLSSVLDVAQTDQVAEIVLDDPGCPVRVAQGDCHVNQCGSLSSSCPMT